MMRLGILLLCYCILVFSCRDAQDTSAYIKIHGETMGTSYNITCAYDQPELLTDRIEKVLAEVNQGMNTYDQLSLISKFNQSEKGMDFDLDTPAARHFYQNMAASRRIVKETNGYFDPTVGPLVNYWGFGPSGRNNINVIDSMAIDSVMQVISFNRVILKKEGDAFTIDKSDPGVQLDFSAIAKGYGVDKIAEEMNQMGIQDYLVEVGGETRLAGKNAKGQNWSLAISEPKINASFQSIAHILSITDRSVATSGNYRNYYEVDGQIFGHTINPFTGYPERSNLLSATIIHDECMYADAYATACMAMGLEQSLLFVNTNPEVSYLFLYTDSEGQLQSADSGDLTFLE
ncbi:MAG: FAD:protein FMN transferase [Bacteroidia bacterium]|nr:FAD:protein FMN transferase [Bacteroidia bacterium]